MERRILTKLTQEDFEIIKNFNKLDHKTLSDFITSFFNYEIIDNEYVTRREKATEFIKAVLEPLIYLRDTNQLNLRPYCLLNNLGFEKLLHLSQRTDIPAEKRANLIKYYDTTYKEYEREQLLNVIDTKYTEQAYSPHGDITMQFTEILGMFEYMLDPPIELKEKFPELYS